MVACDELSHKGGEKVAQPKLLILFLGSKDDNEIEALWFPLCICPKDPVHPTLTSALVSVTFPY